MVIIYFLIIYITKLNECGNCNLSVSVVASHRCYSMTLKTLSKKIHMFLYHYIIKFSNI